ncbi:hypothetical protein O3M35_009535 [Rhynocoris fuscipes]|uniref:Uncharacterized protein n=1 Tax=Rhynocoris fuscipes TaxID=488301 RepID=A0AAW1DA86_9HEMI
MIELESKMYFMHQVMWHPCFFFKLFKQKIFKLAKAVLEIWWTQNEQFLAVLLTTLLVRFT